MSETDYNSRRKVFYPELERKLNPIGYGLLATGAAAGAYLACDMQPVRFNGDANNSTTLNTVNCLSNLITERFESTANWSTEDSNEYELDLTSDGRYYMQTDTDGPTWFIRCVDCEQVTWSEDFQIELEIDLEEGTADLAAALIWGSSNGLENVYRFGINANEEFQIDTDLEETGATILLPLTSFENQAIERAPILTVRSVLGTTFFFINQQLVHSIENIALYGNEVGLSVAPGVEVFFDDLRIWRMKR